MPVYGDLSLLMQVIDIGGYIYVKVTSQGCITSASSNSCLEVQGMR